MRKGFNRKPKADERATQGKNYITPSGLQRLRDEPKVGDSVRNIAPLTRIIGNYSFGPMFSVKGVPTFRILRDPATDDFSREQNPVQLACDVKIELFIPMLKRLCRVRNQTARIDSQGFELLQSAFKILHGQVHA